MKKIKKVILSTGGVLGLAIAPLSAVGMKMNDTQTTKKELFSSVYNKKYSLTNEWTSSSDIVDLISENKLKKIDLSNIFDYGSNEIDITLEGMTDFKVRYVGTKKDVYDTNGEYEDYVPDSIIDVEYLKTGKHWAFKISSSDLKYYKDSNSIIKNIENFLRYAISMQSDWYKEKPENSYQKINYPKFLKEKKDIFENLFYKNPTNLFRSMKNLILSVQNQPTSINKVLADSNINEKLEFNQVFNKQNLFDFKSPGSGYEKIITSNEFHYTTRTKGFVTPSDLLNAKSLYKEHLIKELTKAKINLGKDIDLNKDIKIKVKKVALFPEFKVNGDWDLHYKAEMAGSFFGKSFIIPGKEVKMLSQIRTNNYVQDIYKYLGDAGERIGVYGDRSNLLPLKNNFKTYDEYQKDITQKALAELMKNPDFVINKDFSFADLSKELTLDFTTKNIISHNSKRLFAMLFTDLSVGLTYEVQIDNKLMVNGTKLLLEN